MIQRFDVGTRLSEMAIHNGVVYLAGQIAEDATQGIAGQTQQVLAEIDALLERTGSSRNHMLMAQIWLADINDFAEMNAVWDAWIADAEAPARATGEARLASQDYKVEIIVTAAKVA